MSTAQTRQLDVAEMFRFSDGRTVFVGAVLGSDALVRPCVADLVVDDLRVGALNLEGEMLPDRIHPKGYRAVATLDPVDARDWDPRSHHVHLVLPENAGSGDRADPSSKSPAAPDDEPTAEPESREFSAAFDPDDASLLKRFPFRRGQPLILVVGPNSVEIRVAPDEAPRSRETGLRDAPVHCERPTDAVAESDWEVLQ